MADIGASSSIPSKDEKPVVVRVKRKAYQSPLEAFWLEINERPLKRQLLGLEKLSLSDSPEQVDGLKTKKVFMQHVETISSSEDTIDALQSVVQPKSVDAHECKAKIDERRRSFNTKNKQDQLLVKAKQKQEVLSKNARFEQVWRSRKGKKGAMHNDELREICRIYDVVCVDVEKTTEEVHEMKDTDLEDHMIMSSYLPLLREFIPTAAAEVESDIHDYVSKRASGDDYVYDLYAVKDDISIIEEDASNSFPLVQVDDDDEFYEGPIASDHESDDSNAEDNPMNDYPDEESSEEDDDGGSRTCNDESEELDTESTSNKSSEPKDSKHRNWVEDADLLDDDYMYGSDDGDGEGNAYYCDDVDGDNDNDNQRWSYR